MKHLYNIGLFEIRPSKSPNFKCFLISNGQISDPHCSPEFWASGLQTNAVPGFLFDVVVRRFSSGYEAIVTVPNFWPHIRRRAQTGVVHTPITVFADYKVLLQKHTILIYFITVKSGNTEHSNYSGGLEYRTLGYLKF